MESVFLKSLPFPNPEQLVRLGTSMRALGTAPEVNVLDARDWAAQSRALQAVGMYDVENLTVHLDGSDAPISTSALLADAGLTRVLRVQPLFGRAFVEADFSQGAVPVVILGQRFWRDVFGADPAVVGRSIGLGAARATIVGVWSRAGDRFPLVAPTPDAAHLPTGPFSTNGRLRRRRRARSRTTTMARTEPRRSPNAWRGVSETNAGRSALVDPLQDAMVDPCADDRRDGLVDRVALAIACANIANVLARLRAEREFAVRMSLGATRAASCVN